MTGSLWCGLSSHLDVVRGPERVAVPVEQPEGAARPQRPPEVTGEIVSDAGDLAGYPPADRPGGHSDEEPGPP